MWTEIFKKKRRKRKFFQGDKRVEKVDFFIFPWFPALFSVDNFDMMIV
ncbi:hypothetical protein NBRC3257_0327 [Gluconobacter thailandicus NBRC 3257]|uniref:Uncharacterized protein n=1 Tax=Gluconobacter thailandicus NBRC 3257 TaxID=1381097 RepID=A0ABQ0ISY8_GLUTH|nr:hypothetical protein NBRC3255_3153 [Gluconobacter thailandicus NBRC 3255]GAD25328.1 hypothetical protein NBRC3257_0327 [Gluconobacter thailandicus NBRC 3257]